MNLQDIKAAIDALDNSAIRDAFRALVDYPDEAPIEIGSAGLLVVALNRVTAALAHDAGTMPKGACEALDLPAGASYAQGAQAAQVQAARLATRFARALDDTSTYPGISAGRAF